MSRKRRKFRKVIMLIEFIIFCFLLFLFRYGYQLFGWWFLLYILGCIAVMFVLSAAYFFIADSKDLRWKNEEAQKAADKMAGINMQLSKLYPGWKEKKNGNIAISDWWQKDRQIAAQYLIRYRGAKATEHNLDTANWLYKLGWYRQLQKTSAELEEYADYIADLEDRAANQQAEIAELKIQNLTLQERVDKMAADAALDQGEIEVCNIAQNVLAQPEESAQEQPEADDLEMQVKQLLDTGMTQRKIAEALETYPAKINRIKKKLEGKKVIHDR